MAVLPSVRVCMHMHAKKNTHNKVYTGNIILHLSIHCW